MRYIIQVILVILFFKLPVHLDFILVDMYTYLMLGLGSSFPAPLFTVIIFAAAICLIVSLLLGNKKAGKITTLVSLVVLTLQVIISLSQLWSPHSTWGNVAYISFFILVIICGMLLFGQRKSREKE